MENIVDSIKTITELLREGIKGGKGSGNWGHAGRPGLVGGSSISASFIPSISKADAEQYAKRFVTPSGTVSYRGVDLDMANEINGALTDLYNEGNDLPPFSGIKSTDFERNSRLTDSAAMAVDGAGRLLVNTKIIGNRKKYDAWDEESDRARKYVEDRVNSGSISDPNLLSEAKKLLSFKRQIVSGRIKDLVAHEFMHRFDWERLIRRHNNARTSIIDRRDSWVNRLSSLAGRNAHEYIAESFVAHRNGEEIDQELASLFREYGL